MDQALIQDQFVDAIDDCRRLFVDAVIERYLASPNQLSSDEFYADLEQRFAGLIVKAFVEVAESDLVWTAGEAKLAATLAKHLLRKPVKRSKLKDVFYQLSTMARSDRWDTVLAPMTWYDDLSEHYEELKTAIIRIANIAAKIDGQVSTETVTQLKAIRWQLDQHLPTSEVPPTKVVNSSDQYRNSDDSVSRLADVLNRLVSGDQQDATEKSSTPGDESPKNDKQSDDDSAEDKQATLQNGLDELATLIGIRQVKEEVRTLINVCKLRQHRESLGMPTSPLSLHMVFTGNPGTGKTTVARIMGKLLGAMGVVEKGHLVETDRSGLVAEFLGQTAQKTNEKIDEALDGILFIDEAYSLAPDSQADAYGSEALQTLLKRIEDDRDRLVVILAGYPAPMQQLLKANPGLSSRFARDCHFPDYDAEELCAVFQRLAEQNHYQLTPEFRTVLLAEIQRQIDAKDEHFGNGRAVRNLFESSIRNLANRIVNVAELNPELLSTFQPEDLLAPTPVVGMDPAKQLNTHSLNV